MTQVFFLLSLFLVQLRLLFKLCNIYEYIRVSFVLRIQKKITKIMILLVNFEKTTRYFKYYK